MTGQENSTEILKESEAFCVCIRARSNNMGYMIHFDKDIVSADELKLIETKKAILEKLRVRYGFGEMPNPPALSPQTAPTGLAMTRASQPR